MNRESVSVCMATFNGGKFIREQLDSILDQLEHSDDELIIFDDSSQDETVTIIQNYKSNKIKLYKNSSNIGYVKTFEKAIEKSKNSTIFLCDQDDIWVENRLKSMYVLLNQSSHLLVCSNFKAFNNKGNNVVRFKTKLKHYKPEKFKQNIISIFKGDIAYFGCTMAFKSEFKKYILPFPDYLFAHDLWIAMMGNVLRKVVHLEDITLLHRIHGSNTSFVKRGLHKKIYTRFLFFRTYFEAVKRKNR